MIKRLETVLCLSAVPLGSSGNTTGRIARLQKPYVRRRAKPFNSNPVSKSCAIQAYRLWMEYPSRGLDEIGGDYPVTLPLEMLRDQPLAEFSQSQTPRAGLLFRFAQ